MCAQEMRGEGGEVGEGRGGGREGEGEGEEERGGAKERRRVGARNNLCVQTCCLHEFGGLTTPFGVLPHPSCVGVDGSTS